MMFALVQLTLLHTFAVEGALNCPSGEYLFDGVCELCPDNCSICHSASVCSECKVGYYGESCSMVCNANCRDNVCDKTEGVCIYCSDGYFKDSKKNCTACPSNCLLCFSNTRCTMCKIGFKGRRCQEVCTNCKSGTACDMFTGMCYECKQGLTGKACNKKCDSKCSVCQRVQEDICIACSNEKYGEICENECPTYCVNKTCEDDDGFCTHGCERGYRGPFCDETTNHEDEKQVWIAVVIIYVQGTIIIVICVVVIICIKIRKQVNRKGFALKKVTGGLTGITEHGSHDQKSNVERLADGGQDKEMNKLLAAFPGTERSKKQASSLILFPCQKKKKCTKIPLRKLENMGEDEILNEFKRLSTRTQSKKVPKSYSLAKEYQDRLDAYYIDGYQTTRAYIGCACPGTEEALLFWNMVWNERCGSIVMLADSNVGKEGEQYWPEDSFCFKVGNLTVECVDCGSRDGFEDIFVERKFVIKKDGENRVVLQQHFMAWPEDQVPGTVSSLTKFQTYRDKLTSANGYPVVVHCSDGIGRTGTYIAFESLIKEGRATGSVDVFDCVKRLREQSIVQKMGKQGKNMVQTFEQYSFLYKALNHWFEDEDDSDYEPMETLSFHTLK